MLADQTVHDSSNNADNDAWSVSRRPGKATMTSRILIVDDDGPQRRSLRLGLELAGFEAAAVPSADEALGVLELESFDLAIVDVMMPGVTGLQLVRRLQFRHADLPVVLTSGYHLARHHLERIGLNAVAFVPKPYNLVELTDFLRLKLKQRAAC